MKLLPLLLVWLTACGGTLLRVTEDELFPKIKPALDQHQADLVSRGWTVRDVLVPRTNNKRPLAHIAIATNIIWPAAQATPGIHVFIIGRVPLPRSGFRQNPDGHSDTSGHYPCTAYYAMPSSRWTDVLNNSGYKPLPQFLNLPGDGFFDQDTAPGLYNSFGQGLGGVPLAAIGYLNLEPGANKVWGMPGDKAFWKTEVYNRYFRSLHKWHTGELKNKTPFGFGNFRGFSLDADWGRDTDPYQITWKTSLLPFPVEPFTPFSAFFDFKALPVYTDFWFKRQTPFAKFYLEWCSFQTDWKSTMLIEALMTGSPCAAPVGHLWDMRGWPIKTVGQLWMQTVEAKVGYVYPVLYGDPTVMLN